MVKPYTFNVRDMGSSPVGCTNKIMKYKRGAIRAINRKLRNKDYVDEKERMSLLRKLIALTENKDP